MSDQYEKVLVHLEKEIERLKAENAQLKVTINHCGGQECIIEDLQAEIERLKAENERLESETDYLGESDE